MTRAQAIVTTTVALCFLTNAFAQTNKGAKKPATKPEAKASKEDEKRNSKAPDTLEGLRKFAAEKMDAGQKASVQKLKSEVETLESKSEVTPQMITDLKAALLRTLNGTLKPSETSASKLANDLATLVADGKLCAENLLKVQGDVQAMLFSASVTDTQLSELKTSMQAIAKSSNLCSSDTQSLVSAAESVAKNASSASDAKKEKGGAGGGAKAKPGR